ncbi:MAG: lysophospholipid acyltransferase family protein [Xanthomonadales bacterium]
MIAAFSRWLLKLFGWTLHIDDPGTRRYVLIVAPHTSNWDFMVGILAARAIRLDAHWIGKHTLFRPPFGWLFRALGGIPVDRGRSGDLIPQVVRHFDESETFKLGLAPEGTRSATDHWKSGFHHIARAASVPIVMGWLDYPTKRIGMGGAFMPDDDVQHTFDRVRAFYAPYRGRYPEKASAIRARSK